MHFEGFPLHKEHPLLAKNQLKIHSKQKKIRLWCFEKLYLQNPCRFPLFPESYLYLKFLKSLQHLMMKNNPLLNL